MDGRFAATARRPRPSRIGPSSSPARRSTTSPRLAQPGKPSAAPSPDRQAGLERLDPGIRLVDPPLAETPVEHEPLDQVDRLRNPPRHPSGRSDEGEPGAEPAPRRFIRPADPGQAGPLECQGPRTSGSSTSSSTRSPARSQTGSTSSLRGSPRLAATRPARRGWAAAASTLPEFPTDITDSMDYVKAVAARLSAFTNLRPQDDRPDRQDRRRQHGGSLHRDQSLRRQVPLLPGGTPAGLAPLLPRRRDGSYTAA